MITAESRTLPGDAQPGGWSRAFVPSRAVGRSSVRAGLLAVAPLLPAPAAVVPHSLAPDAYNEPPIVKVTTGWTEVEPGGRVSLTATAEDLDGAVNGIEWTATAGRLVVANDWSSYPVESGATWTAPNEPGDVDITVTAVDNDGLEGSASVTVTVTANPAPWVTVTAEPGHVVPGGVVRLTATAGDPDGGPVTYAWSAPSGTFDATDAATATWTAPSEPGVFEIRVEVTDDEGQRASAAERVIVSFQERLTLTPGDVVALRLTDMRVTVTGAMPLSANYQVHASGCGHWSSGSEDLPIATDGRGHAVVDAGFHAYQPDEDGEYCTVQLEFHDDISGWTAQANTNLFIRRNTSPPPTPTPTVSLSASPNPVEEGESVTVTAGLSEALASSVTIPLTLAAGTAESDDYGSLASITVNGGALTGTGTVTTAGDDDEDHETFTVALGALPAGLAAGSPSSIQVTIRDDDGAPPPPPPPPPTANRAPTVTVSCDPCVVARGGEVRLTSTASDPDGDPLTYSWSAPMGGFAGPVDASTIRWTAPDAIGPVTIRAQVSDGRGGWASASVTVEVVNRAPTVTASCDPCTVARGGEVRLEATATDPDRDPLTYAWSAPKGRFEGPVDGPEARWTAPAEPGRVTIRIEVSDSQGGSASAEVEIEVVNRPPAFAQPVYAFELPENVDGSEQPVELGRVAAEDPDGDALTYEVVSGDGERFVVGARDGAVRYVGPGEDFEAEPNRFDLTVRARDGLGAESAARVAVSVTDVNEPPEVSATCDPCSVARGGEVRLEATATDPDGDPLTYQWSASKGRFSGSSSRAAARWTAPAELGPVAIRVEVSDGRGGSASAEVEVEVINRPPTFAQPVYAFELPENLDGRERPADLGPVAAEDPDGDALTYEMVSGDGQRFMVGARDGVVRYVGPGEDFETEPNQFELTVRALDGVGGEARAEIAIGVTDVNERPAAADDEAVTAEDEAVTVDVLANDTDPEGGRLRITAVSAAAHGTTRLASGGGVTYTPDADYHGVDSFTYVVSDLEGLTATATVEVAVLPVNDPPSAVGVIPDQALDEGSGAADVDLAPFFGDVDGDALTYGARSSDPGVVGVSVAGAILTLTPAMYGSASVTVWAEDPGGLRATRSVRVAVSDRPQRAVIANMLAATARGHLASVRTALGRRIADDSCDASRLTVMGRSLPLGREAAAMLEQLGTDARLAAEAALGLGEAAGAPGGTMRMLTRPGAPMPREPETAARGAADRLASAVRAVPARTLGLGGGAGAGGAEFLLGWGGGQEGARCPGRGRWSLWGQGDVQSFQGTPTVSGQESAYNGDLTTGYLGVDARLGEHWLAGVALSRSEGAGDWRAGASEGHLTQTMTAIHPYLRWTDGATSVWTSVGAGRGNAENLRAAGRRGASATYLRLGMVELGRRLGDPGGLDVNLVGDAAWAALRTDDGEETIDGQDVRVNQVRIGADLVLPARLGGAALAPFGKVYARRDGGAGQTGTGVEVAGGVRAALGIVRLDAQARMLALHSAAGYGERGAALTLTVGARGSEGLSLSISPRWGDPALGAGALRHGPLGRGPRPQGPRSDSWILDARANYAASLPWGLQLDLFGGYDAAAAEPGFGLRVGLPGKSPG